MDGEAPPSFSSAAVKEKETHSGRLVLFCVALTRLRSRLFSGQAGEKPFMTGRTTTPFCVAAALDSCDL